MVFPLEDEGTRTPVRRYAALIFCAKIRCRYALSHAHLQNAIYPGQAANTVFCKPLLLVTDIEADMAATLPNSGIAALQKFRPSLRVTSGDRTLARANVDSITLIRRYEMRSFGDPTVVVEQALSKTS